MKPKCENGVESQATTDLRPRLFKFRVARASRVLVLASRRNNLSRKARDQETRALPGSRRKTVGRRFLAANV